MAGAAGAGCLSPTARRVELAAGRRLASGAVARPRARGRWRTALELQGYAHYLAHSTAEVHLYGVDPPPGWLFRLPLHTAFAYHSTDSLFADDLAVGAALSCAMSQAIQRQQEMLNPTVMVMLEHQLGSGTVLHSADVSTFVLTNCHVIDEALDAHQASHEVAVIFWLRHCLSLETGREYRRL